MFDYRDLDTWVFFLIFHYKFIANIEIDLLYRNRKGKKKCQYQQQIIKEIKKPRVVPIIQTLIFVFPVWSPNRCRAETKGESHSRFESTVHMFLFSIFRPKELPKLPTLEGPYLRAKFYHT